MKASFFTVTKIGPKQSLTPEGFLLCEDVPIARTGMMVYGPNEVPVSTGADGIVKIFREEEDIFHVNTIASILGKPITDNHPEDDVIPNNWKDLTHGIALNPRRGIGAYDDLLLADLLITTPEGIEAVQAGRREVSCGYEADYEETEPGIGKQSNIIVNHIALVDQGRCGPRCAISDRQPNELKEITMAKKSKVLDLLMKAFKAKDAGEVEKLAEETKDEGEGVDPEDLHLHIHNDPDASGNNEAAVNDVLQAYIEQNDAEHAEIRARLDALEQALAESSPTEAEAENEEMVEQMQDEVPENLKEESVKAKDSSYLSDSYKDTVALAEILTPGIKAHTFDRAAKPVDSFRKICNLRRQSLDLAWGQPATRGIIEDLTNGKTLDTSAMTCDSVRTMFRSAAAIRRAANNSGSQTFTTDTGIKKAGPLTPADLNRLNTERYAK